MKKHPSPLDQFLRELKQHDSLDDVLPECRYAVATSRLCCALLWIASDLSSISSTLNEEHLLLYIKQVVSDAAYQFAVFCLVYQITFSSLQLRPRTPEKPIDDRKQRLCQLSKQLLGICWTLCHTFTPEKLQETKELRQYDASVQLGCAWYVLLELGSWCHADLVQLFRSRLDKEHNR